MRSKRYFASDLRSAVLKVRQELGSDATILSHQRLASGVEVTAIPGKEALNKSRTDAYVKKEEETLGVKNVRESFDHSVEAGIQFFNADANNHQASAVVSENKAEHSVVKQGTGNEKSSGVGDTIMHEKTSNTSKQETAKTTQTHNREPVEHDFEAEMNMILNTHYVSLTSNDHLVEAKSSKPAKTKPSKKANTQSSKSVSARSKKPSAKSRKTRTRSKVHTALNGLKINSEEKQTIIRSSQRDFSEKAVPPVLMNAADQDEFLETIEMRIGEHAYGDNARKNPVKAALIRQLMKLDLSPVIIQNVVDMLVSDKIDQKMLLPQAMAIVANQIPIYKEDITSIGGTIALFGATGVGKTTTIAKLAARYALKHGSEKVALITTDNNRVASTEQLRTYSNILGMPLRIARNDIEVLNALNTFSDKEFVLIDTAGMTPKEIKQSKFYDLFAGGITQIKKFQVLPATMNRTALEKISAAYRGLSPDGSIITKVDETASLGGAISVAIQNHLPIAFYANGQTVPDDFHLARAHILMSRVTSVAVQFDDLESDNLNDQFTPGIASNVSI